MYESSTLLFTRLRVVPHFSSGILERAKRERAWKSPHARKAIRGGERDGMIFQARSRFVRSTIPEEKWGTTRCLPLYYSEDSTQFFIVKLSVGFGAEKYYLWFQARIRPLMEHAS